MANQWELFSPYSLKVWGGGALTDLALFTSADMRKSKYQECPRKLEERTQVKKKKADVSIMMIKLIN